MLSRGLIQKDANKVLKSAQRQRRKKAEKKERRQRQTLRNRGHPRIRAFRRTPSCLPKRHVTRLGAYRISSTRAGQCEARISAKAEARKPGLTSGFGSGPGCLKRPGPKNVEDRILSRCNWKTSRCGGVGNG